MKKSIKKSEPRFDLKSKEERLWDYLVKTLSKLDDNNYTARKIYDKVESLTPILFKKTNP